jgi:CRISPR-associated protein Csx16
MTVLFVTRHTGARDWATRQGHDAATIVAHLEPSQIASLRPGDTVIGTLPVNIVAELCARGVRYLHLSLDLPAEARGRDLSADEMDAFGARLEAFDVRAARDGAGRAPGT